MMRNKFLKITFVALCLSISSIVNAMNQDDQENCSEERRLGGKYWIMQYDTTAPASGSVIIRQESRGSLTLEDFTLTGGYYLEHIQEIASESEEGNPNFTSPVNTENRRIANFILSKMPKKLQLNGLEDSDTESQYGGRAMYDEEEVHVYFRRERNSIFGEMIEILVESPLSICSVVPVKFNLVKEGSAFHEFMKACLGSVIK